MREKDLGIWRAISWREYGERARAVGMGLVALGLSRGDVVSILADNRAGMALRRPGHDVARAASPTASTPPTRPSRSSTSSTTARTRFLFVEDEEQLDKVLEVRDALPRCARSSSSTWRACATSTTRR